MLWTLTTSAFGIEPRAHRYLITLSLFVLCCSLSELRAQQRTYLIIRKVEGNTVQYETYKNDGQQSIDISDLTLWEKMNSTEVDLFNTFYNDTDNVRVLLLRLGYAKFNDSSKATPQEMNAQQVAQSDARGIWKQPPVPPPPTDGINWGEIWKRIWQGFLVLGSVGAIGAISKKLYRTHYIQRRINLLIIGEPSGGKTALLTALVDPHASKTELLNVDPTKGSYKKRGFKHIPRGKFEIIPEITDVSGTAYASVFDKLIESHNHALLVVICPYKDNGVNKDDGSRMILDIETNINHKYIDMQISYVQAFIEGGLGSKHTKKPKIVMMFISKFDLFSEHHPDDSASQQTKLKLQNLFKDHIDSARSAAKKANITFELIFGSAVERWNTEQILTIVARALYKI